MKFIWKIVFFAPLLATAGNLVSSHPEPGAKDVDPGSSFNLRFSDALDPRSLQHIELHRSDGKRVPVKASTDLTNASITIVPAAFLQPRMDYRLTGTQQVKTASGSLVEPFDLSFRTAAKGRFADSSFEAVTFDHTRSMTTVLFGPDRKLYAASAFGEIVCWDLDENGRPKNRKTLFQDPSKSRQYIDLEWDPEAGPEQLLLWVSYSERLTPKEDPRHYFTGEVARLRIVDGKIAERKIYVRGLPHGRERQGGFDTLPHQPNGLCFRGGKLYQTVGSTSSSGGPGNWGIKEQPFSACIIEIDYQNISDPVDLYQNKSPRHLRRFATGVRNALELLSHSNGHFYTAVNINDRSSRKDGVPDDPEIPGDQNELIRNVTPNHESLYIIEEGRHYGFPNPSIGNYVLAGGNPTGEKDPFEITDYPFGTKPDPGFAPELMFPIWKWGGSSPNGMIEYQPDFPHPLSRAIFCCFFSANSIAVMPLGIDGMPTEVVQLRSPKGKLQFSGPLDITQDPKTGSIYVADFGRQSLFGKDGSMVWLKPHRERK
ncbi:MAG: Ig-like domain-containing protein [Verrucomicrobiales bacterium]|nr:Ig-like domain-containing protein [Verrucomicrobiales bacterium]